MMKIVYSFFIVMQIFLSEINGYKRHEKWHRDSKYTKVTMPSGNRYSVIAPQSSKQVCIQKSRLVELRPKDKRWRFEYNLMQKEFKIGNKNGFKAKVVKVQKVFNPCLWSAYKYRQVQIGRETRSVNERMLYHQSKVALRIALEGFDERFARIEGQFGAGIYFSKDIKHLNCREMKRGQHCQILLSRVSLGKVHTESYPKHFANPPVGAHSVVGLNPSHTYVIYRGQQAYPEYLITYTVEKKPVKSSPAHSSHKKGLLYSYMTPTRQLKRIDLNSIVTDLGFGSLNG